MRIDGVSANNDEVLMIAFSLFFEESKNLHKRRLMERGESRKPRLDLCRMIYQIDSNKLCLSGFFKVESAELLF